MRGASGDLPDERASSRPPAPSYAVAVLHHRDETALDRCLASLAGQSQGPIATAVIDIDSPVGKRSAGFEATHIAMANLGYAGGGNRAVEWLRSELSPPPDFLLLLTADVELGPDFARVLVSEVAERQSVALATGKLLRSDGVTVDSAGIRLPIHRQPRDRGSGERDSGRFDEVEEVFAATGAALLLRVAALTDLEVEGELFDGDFFMYREDTDLSWRAGLLGFKVLYVPQALAQHERGWKRDLRFDVPVELRRHSFKNHYLQWLKNERLGTLLLTLPIFLGWEVLRLGFACLRDPAILPAYLHAVRLVPGALRKRRAIQRRARERRRTSGP